MINRKVTSYLIALVVLCGTATAQPLPEPLRFQLQRTLDSLRAAHGIPGISAGVLLPEHEMWQGTSGGSHPGVPVHPAMLFGIGSNSKLFTAVAVSKCVESGLLTFEDSLHEWLPAFAHIDSTITIRQLLNHTSGLADINEVAGYPDSILKNPERIFTREEVLGWIGPPHFAAGTSWEYCNTNYILAGMIVERAASQPFAVFLRDSILAPLQLDSTFLPVDEALSGIIAQPWANNINISGISRNSLLSAAWCAGAMYSSSGEMAQWYEALMEGRVLQPESFKEMTTFVSSGNYGFGIAERMLNGRLVWQHGGSIRGYTSQMLYDTTLKAVICVLTNETPAPAALIAQLLHGELVSRYVTSIVNMQTPESTWHIYPNPASNVVTIGHAQGPVRIYDVLGRLWWTGMGAESLRIDIKTFPTGLYAVYANNVVKTFRIM
jgi:D-alanyl-D-alanine carboxypeptidase